MLQLLLLLLLLLLANLVCLFVCWLVGWLLTLKQPLSSFMTGIDIISHIVVDVLSLVDTPLSSTSTVASSSASSASAKMELRSQNIKEHMQTINFCVNNIRNTNVFMLMTINRCIDYTKASKGLMLVPKFETIDLSEALYLPLTCMRNIQNKLSIEFKPFDHAICSHIITDKQWLQENILCLLSNAVKYSSEGTVTIAVSLQSNVECIPNDSSATEDGTDNNSVNGVKKKPKRANSITSSQSHDVNVGASSAVVIPTSSQSGTAATSAKVSRVYPLTTDCGDTCLDQFIQPQPLSGMSSHRSADLTDTVQWESRVFTKDVNTSNNNSNHNYSSKNTSSNNNGFMEMEDISEALFADQSLSKTSPPLQSSSLSEQDHSSSLLVNKQVIVDEFLCFEIDDHGIGVNREQMKVLFNPFKQAQRLAGGTGLGLYSLAKRVEALKGRCGVRKRADGQQGSSFWFSIPYRPDAFAAKSAQSLMKSMSVLDMSLFPPHTCPQHNEGDTKSSSSSLFGRDESVMHLKNECSSASVLATLPCCSPTDSNEVSQWKSTYKDRLCSASKGRQLNILIVEDSPPIAKMTSMLLHRHGHLVTLAENGEIALRRIKSRWDEVDRVDGDELSIAYDVVLMDLQMPVMDGLEATTRLRHYEKKEGRDRQCVIGVSANSDHETAKEAFHSGIDDFLSKPFDIESFYKAVRGIGKRLV
jgi:CheY-like chemotaxis protein